MNDDALLVKVVLMRQDGTKIYEVIGNARISLEGNFASVGGILTEGGWLSKFRYEPKWEPDERHSEIHLTRDI